MVRDKSTYGFSKSDAAELIQLIGSTDRSYREGLVRGTGSASQVKVYEYTLAANMTSSGASASFVRKGTTGPAKFGTALDVAGTASHQIAGDTGVAIFGGTDYVIVEPACDFELTSTTGGINPGTSPTTAN